MMAKPIYRLRSWFVDTFFPMCPRGLPHRARFGVVTNQLGNKYCWHGDCMKASFKEVGIFAPPSMAGPHSKQIDDAKKLLPLVSHVASGGWLEFKHNDGYWIVVKGSSFQEVVCSPSRYRVSK